jgi:plastocyanin
VRKLIVLIAAVALVASLAATAFAATKTVRVGDNFFSPKKLTVTKNTTVRWRFVGDSLHTVTVTKGPVKFNSKALRSGSYSKKMTRKGTYRIICAIHPDEQKMTLVVR